MRKSRGVTTYSGVHVALTRERGKATQYVCACGKQAKEWALNHGAAKKLFTKTGVAFSISLDDYQPMCIRCHRMYDKSLITHCPHGHPYEGDNLIWDAGKRKCRTCVYARNRSRKHSDATKAKRLEYQRRWRAARRGRAA